MELRYFTNYIRIARRGLAPPLLCDNCSNELITRLGDKDEPVLYCATCNTTMQPGLRMYENVVAVVKEFYV